MIREIFERDKELATLQELMADCLQHKGGLVTVSGVSSSGKSTLLHAFADDAVNSGARVISAIGSRAEQALSFGITRQILRGAESISSTAKGLSFLLEADALGGTLTGHGLGEVDTAAAQLLDRLSGALLGLAEQGPLVIVVDDVQHADIASLHTILYLGRRIRSSPVLLVLAEGEPVDARFHAELLGQPRARRIRLGMLSPCGVAEMVASHLGIGSPQPISADWHALSGGNPLLVRALIDDTNQACHADPGERRVPVVGEAFEKAVLTCLYRCTREARLAAQALAVLFQPSPLDVLAQLADLESGAAERAMRELSATGLAEAGDFRHQGIRASVLLDIPKERQAGLHRQAAALLRFTGADPTTVARHLVSAADVSEPWQHAVLEEAAEQGLSNGESEFAIDCLRLAHRGGGADRLATVRAMLTRAEWTVNPLVAEAHLPGLVEALREDRLTCRYAIRVIKYLLWSGRLEDAQACFDCVELKDPHPGCRHRLELNLAKGWLTYSHPPMGARISPMPASGDGAYFPSVTERPALLAAEALSAALLDGATQGAIASAKQVLQQPILDDQTVRPALEALLAMIYADCPDQAGAWSDSLQDGELARLGPTWQALLTWVRAEAALRLGKPRAAERLTQTALAKFCQRSWGIAIGGPVATLVQANTAMGETAEAARYLSLPVPQMTFESVFGLHYLYARGRYNLAVNQPSAALDNFEACGELMKRWQIGSPAIVPWPAGAAHSLIMLGDQRSARELATKQLTAMDGSHRRSRGACLRVLGLTSELRERRQMLSEAVDVLEEAGDRVELAYALHDLSKTLHALGHSQRARLLLHRTRRLAEECQITLLNREPDGSAPEPVPTARTSGNGTELPGVLSEAERRVAMLAAQGSTNWDIARKLYITVSTVEQHLTRAYRKLKVSNRSDLAAIMTADSCQEHESAVG